MIGAIIGDIVGSIYEFDNIKTKEFPFFGKGCNYTDDTLMTLAVAKGLLDVPNFEEETLRQAFIRNMKELARKYPCPVGGYGGRFVSWVMSDDVKPYNSWGNGSAMRVSPCGFAASSLVEAQNLARLSAEVTHNHPEAVSGAQITASCIYLARIGESKEAIRNYVEQCYCKLDKTVSDYQRTYSFTERCSETVPPAIQAFLEASDFEDAIRNAVAIGGDSDTLAAITGGIAEAYYGVPENIRNHGRSYLSGELLDILDAFEVKYRSVKTD